MAIQYPAVCRHIDCETTETSTGTSKKLESRGTYLESCLVCCDQALFAQAGHVHRLQGTLASGGMSLPEARFSITTGGGKSLEFLQGKIAKCSPTVRHHCSC